MMPMLPPSRLLNNGAENHHTGSLKKAANYPKEKQCAFSKVYIPFIID